MAQRSYVKRVVGHMTVLDYAFPLSQALWVTCQITVLACLLATIISFIAGIGRLSKWIWIRWSITLYVEFFRGTSCFVQLFWLFFALPLFGIYLDAFWVGVVALGLNIGSFGSEVVRASILSVPKEQIEAGIALNFTRWHRMRRVILPQAMVTMLPPMSNLMLELLKSTPLVSLITINELTFTAHLIRQQTGETFQTLGGILVIYFILASGIAWVFSAFERRFSVGMAITTRNP